MKSLQTTITNLYLNYVPCTMCDAKNRAFQVMEQIGEGGQGRVYRIRYHGTPPIHDQIDYAYKKASSPKRKQSIMNERDTLQALRNVNGIARYISHTTDGFIRPYYQTIADNHIYKYGEDVLNCIENLHTAGWVHGDIKHDNFCLDAQNRTIMVDLGSAQRTNSFNVNTLETAIFSMKRRNQLSELFATRPNLSPTIIDFYGFAWMMYRSMGGWAEPTWKNALPTRTELNEWQPPGIDKSLYQLLRNLFLESII
jgi:serine/threonine protein kinase